MKKRNKKKEKLEVNFQLREKTEKVGSELPIHEGMWYYNTSMIIDLINRVKGVDKLEVAGGEKWQKI